MRSLATAALVLLFTTGTALAQRGGFRGGGFGGGFRAPGGGIHRGAIGGGFHRGGFIGGFHRGHLGFRGGFYRGLSGFHHNRGFYLPYSYVFPVTPVLPTYGSVWDYGLGYPAPMAAVTPPSAYPATPAVVITQQYATPVIRETSPLVRPYVPPARMPAVREAPDDRSAVIYLLAFSDHVIRPALAYWIDGGTIHYLGLDKQQRQAPLAAVDRDLSLQLNRERGVPFRLPSGS